MFMKIHVNGTPGKIAIVLRVKVADWFVELLEAIDPHFGRGEGMAPVNEADAVPDVIGFLAQFGDGVGRDHSPV